MITLTIAGLAIVGIIFILYEIIRDEPEQQISMKTYHKFTPQGGRK